VRSTLERVESSEASDDKQSAVQQLRRSVIRVIAERELRKETLDVPPAPMHKPEEEPAA